MQGTTTKPKEVTKKKKYITSAFEKGVDPVQEAVKDKKRTKRILENPIGAGLAYLLSTGS